MAPDTAARLSPDDYAHSFKFDLDCADLLTERSAQARSGLLGASDMGSCAERARRITVQQPATDAPEKLPAIIGGYVDAGIKAARRANNPHLSFDVTTSTRLPNGAVVGGHADEVDPQEPAVTDYKTRDGVRTIRRTGPVGHHRWQVHTYYAGLVQSGDLPPEGIVRIVYLDRSGKDKDPVVWQEPYNPAVLDEIADWLDAVNYAVLNGEEAAKERPVPWCRNYCEFYTACRGGEPPQPVGPLPGDYAVLADLYHQTRAQHSADGKLLDELKSALGGVNGLTETVELRSTWVNHKTSPYWLVDTVERTP